MKRLRIEFDGAIYHVTQRSNNREKILGHDGNKKYFLELVKKLKKELNFNIFGYVIMDNHYHLLLQTGRIPLNKVMQRLNFLYSRYFNRKYKRKGHVFGGRYSATLIQDERYLFAVLRYIHQNPVKAAICNKVSNYIWSSDAAYRNNDNKFIDIDFILDTFSLSRADAITNYKELMDEIDEINIEKATIIGDEEFVKNHIQKIRMENSNLGKIRKSLEEILYTCVDSEADILLIRSGSRRRHLREYKKKYASMAKSEGYSFREIADYINISDAAVSKLIS